MAGFEMHFGLFSPILTVYLTVHTMRLRERYGTLEGPKGYIRLFKSNCTIRYDQKWSQQIVKAFQ